jgi:hypothetical protein
MMLVFCSLLLSWLLALRSVILRLLVLLRDGNRSGRPKIRPAKNYSRVEFNTQTRTCGCNLAPKPVGFRVPVEFL